MEHSSAKSPVSKSVEILIVAAFCLAFAFFVYRFAAGASVTYDETTHLPSGYSYLLWGDYRMNPEHPPLVKKLAALPLLKLGVWPREPDFSAGEEQPQSSASLSQLQRSWEFALLDPGPAQWSFGRTMLFGIRDGRLRDLGVSAPQMLPPSANLDRADFLNNADQMLFCGRMMILLLGLLLAVLIYLWARELHGVPGGVLALALFCFDPNCIAHSGLVTTDIGISAFMFGSVYFLWRTCRRLNIFNAAFTALFFALAFATKFSALLLLPMFGLLGLWRTFAPGNWLLGRRHFLAGRLRKSLAFAGLFILCCVAAFVMIWGMYGFRYSAIADPGKSAGIVERLFPGQKAGHEPGTLPIAAVVRRTAAIKSLLGEYPQEIPETKIQAAMDTARPGFTGNLILFATQYHLLPEACIYGFASEEMNSLLRWSFLMGDYSIRGFWGYFFWSFLFKTPLPALIMVASSLVVAFRNRIGLGLPWAFFVVPVGLYALVSLNSGLNIGHRHLLPIYPFLYVFCGVLGARWMHWKPVARIWTAFGALGAIALSSAVVFAPPWKPAVVFPHYLAYFNELAGGPRNGKNLLVDSNLDWGQDLKGLKEWLDAHPGSAHAPQLINLCYFGSSDPRYYGIPHVNVLSFFDFETPMQNFCRNNDGTISITNAIVPGYLAVSATQLTGISFSPRDRVLWREMLQHATLVDSVGYSIYIYKLDQASFAPSAMDMDEAELESIPYSFAAYGAIGNSLYRQRRFAEAAGQYERSLQINPNYPDTLDKYAWLLATAADPALRNGTRAVELSLKANQLAGQNPAMLDTLAAAYAEAGRFPNAVETANRAVQAAESQGDSAAGKVLQEHLNLYQARQPLRN